jgi:predicted dehydrogenase
VSAPEVHVPGGHHLAVIEEFVATVRSGSWANAYGDYALHRSRVIDAVYQSAAEHREVEVA